MKNTIRALTIGALQGNFGFDPGHVRRTQLKRNKYVTLNSENHGKIKLIFRTFFELLFPTGQETVSAG